MSLRFYTLLDGLKSAVEFKMLGDGGLTLLVDRNVYH
jgi:hypothetical protein